jgi:hypothetical protein
MKKYTLFLLLLISIAFPVSAQNLWTYSPCGGTCPNYSFVAVNATGTNILTTGFGSNTPCGSGGISGMTNNGVFGYAPGNAHAYFKITPNTGYSLNVTGLTTNLRKSGSGLTLVRFAYSLDNGATWVTNGADLGIPNAGCGSGGAVNWAAFTPVNVTNPVNGIIFALYPHSPGASGGVWQINNINVTGSVSSACTVPALSSTFADISCNGYNNGSIDLTTVGGSFPFTYAWSGPASFSSTNQDISGLAAGTYTVVVTATGGCTTSTTVTIAEPAAVTATITSSTNVSCHGASDGSATVVASGGTNTYTYAWTPSGGTGTTASGLAADTYTVTVTDANGCKGSTTIIITEPAVLTASISSSTDASCNGGTNGSATVLASGGTLSYSYAWSPSGGIAATASGLAANTYTVVVTDAHTCTTSATVIISEPSPLVANISSSTDISCIGGSDGSATVVVSGGTIGYTYAWSPTGGIGASASGLLPDTYIVTVTDAHNCTSTASVILSEPTALVLTTTNTNISCNGVNNGSIDLSVSGGTFSYDYDWSNGAITQDISSLGTGIYTVTVTDVNGCTASTSDTITQPGTLGLSATHTDVSCFGASNGSIDLTVSGGVLTYDYDWSNSAITEDLSSLSAGTYDVTVTDANGCTASTSVNIAAPAALNLSSTHANVSCNGGSNGSIDLTVSGGTLSYNYDWSNTSVTQDLSGITAGNYSVTVTDGHGCTSGTSVVITEPTVLTLTTFQANVGCNGGSNGNVDLNVSGGTLSYGYLWNNGAISQDISSIPAGTYSVTVTDGNGCTGTISVNVSEPAAIDINSTHIDPGCAGVSNGSIDISVLGGIPSYTYVWSNTAITQDITDLAAGTYTVTVTDGNVCTATHSVLLTAGLGLDLSATWSNASCNGGNNGAINLTVNTGVPLFTYVWSNSAATQDISGLAAGTYTVLVTDASGCTGTYAQGIGEPGLITSSISASACGSYTSPSGLYTWTTSGLYTDTLTAASGCDSLIGVDLTITHPDVSVNALGHTFTANLSGASYQWLDCNNFMNPVIGANNQTYTSPVNGNFAVIVNQGGCADTSACMLTANTGIDEDGFAGSVHLYPNPTNGIFNISIDGLYANDITIDITDITGKQVYNQAIGTIEGSTTIPFMLTDLREGIYLLRINVNGSSKVIRFVKAN